MDEPIIFERVPDARALGRRLREARRDLGLRQEDVALAAGTGRRFVGEVENGKPTARLGDVMDLVSVLGLELLIRERGGNRRGSDA